MRDGQMRNGKMRNGKMVAIKDTQVTLHEEDTQREWKPPYVPSKHQAP
ncbi:hypothetical protein J7E70_32465 [Variovorax paradoxus]|nr:hypothetical protein [Variovorax paradoxus]MBT2305122.1 hypothetical protein [Variovorax paradoxus]